MISDGRAVPQTSYPQYIGAYGEPSSKGNFPSRLHHLLQGVDIEAEDLIL